MCRLLWNMSSHPKRGEETGCWSDWETYTSLEEFELCLVGTECITEALKKNLSYIGKRSLRPLSLSLPITVYTKISNNSQNT